MRPLWTFLFVTLSFAPGVNAQGFITTVAGNGIAGFSGDGGPATSARLNFPSGVTVDASGNLFIADLSNQRIRKVDATTGIITTVAGNGIAGFSGDGGPATDASLRFPFGGVAVDTSGNIFIADQRNHRIRGVMSVGELIQQLIADVVALNLIQGIENSLDSKLEAVSQALDDLNQNNDVAAINILMTAFINAVQAQSGNQIPVADADDLIAAAQDIIALLGG